MTYRCIVRRRLLPEPAARTSSRSNRPLAQKLQNRSNLNLSNHVLMVQSRRVSRRQFMSNRSLGTWLALGALAFVCAVVPASAESHVRIVRLSNVEGTVQVDRNTGQGLEKAFLNM